MFVFLLFNVLTWCAAAGWARDSGYTTCKSGVTECESSLLLATSLARCSPPLPAFPAALLVHPMDRVRRDKMLQQVQLIAAPTSGPPALSPTLLCKASSPRKPCACNCPCVPTCVALRPRLYSPASPPLWPPASPPTCVAPRPRLCSYVLLRLGGSVASDEYACKAECGERVRKGSLRVHILSSADHRASSPPGEHAYISPC